MDEDSICLTKYEALKRRVRDIEEQNDALHVRIHKARKSISRLKLERTFLLERMEKSHGGLQGRLSIDSDLSEPLSDMLHEGLVGRLRQSKRGQMDKSTQLKPVRKKKDPNAPKGPGNVFFLFCRMERDKIKDEFPQESLGDVTKILGQKWKGLTKEGRQQYYNLYRKEQEEYQVAMKSYTSNHGIAHSVPGTAQDDEDDDDDNDVAENAEAEAENAATIAATGGLVASSTSSPRSLSPSTGPGIQADSDHHHSDPIDVISSTTPTSPSPAWHSSIPQV